MSIRELDDLTEEVKSNYLFICVYVLSNTFKMMQLCMVGKWAPTPLDPVWSSVIWLYIAIVFYAIHDSTACGNDAMVEHML